MTMFQRNGDLDILVRFELRDEVCVSCLEDDGELVTTRFSLIKAPRNHKHLNVGEFHT
jgi:hypothetical protein